MNPRHRVEVDWQSLGREVIGHVPLRFVFSKARLSVPFLPSFFPLPSNAQHHQLQFVRVLSWILYLDSSNRQPSKMAPTQQTFELDSPGTSGPSSPSTPSSDFPFPSRPPSTLHQIQNLASSSHLPPHLQTQPSYQSSAAQSRDSSPARSSTFRRADRARRSLLNSSSFEDSWVGRLKRWRHGKVS